MNWKGSVGGCGMASAEAYGPENFLAGDVLKPYIGLLLGRSALPSYGYGMPR